MEPKNLLETKAAGSEKGCNPGVRKWYDIKQLPDFKSCQIVRFLPIRRKKSTVVNLLFVPRYQSKRPSILVCKPLHRNMHYVMSTYRSILSDQTHRRQRARSRRDVLLCHASGRPGELFCFGLGYTALALVSDLRRKGW